MSTDRFGRRALLKASALAAGAALAAPFAGAAAAGRAQRPNVVFVLADDLGWADLGCYGNRFNETPNIDRLAAQGVRFTQFYAASPVCSPTRYSIMSGQYPARAGLTAHIPGHWRPFERVAEPPPAQFMPPDVPTVAEILRGAGYATAHFGKWHLGTGKHGPGQRGFDVAEEFGGNHNVPPARLPPGSPPKRLAEHLGDLAARFIESNRGTPFFLHIGHTSPHIPLNTTEALLAKYTRKAPAPGYPSRADYAGLVEEMDASVGRVMAKLEELGLADNTVVIFVSDNGGLTRESGGWPGTSNAPLREQKGTLYEGGIRVPLIIRWPGAVPAGAVCDAVGGSVDFFPTLLELAGAAAPEEHVLDGQSLMPVLRNVQGPHPRRTVYWHYPHYHTGRPSGAIRDGDYKLIEFFETGRVELYDLKADPGELRDLSGEAPDRAAALLRKLRAWRRTVCAQMPQPNPAYNPQRAEEWWDRRAVKPTEAPGTYRQPTTRP